MERNDIIITLTREWVSLIFLVPKKDVTNRMGWLLQAKWCVGHIFNAAHWWSLWITRWGGGTVYIYPWFDWRLLASPGSRRLKLCSQCLSTFQHMMDNRLRGSDDFAAAYLDDLVIYSVSWEVHIRQILQRLRGAGLETKRMLPNIVTWTMYCENVFWRLRGFLTQTLALQSPNFSRLFILQTDASDRGLGALLNQKDLDRFKHLVAYFSRNLLSMWQLSSQSTHFVFTWLVDCL